MSFGELYTGEECIRNGNTQAQVRQISPPPPAQQSMEASAPWPPYAVLRIYCDNCSARCHETTRTGHVETHAHHQPFGGTAAPLGSVKKQPQCPARQPVQGGRYPQLHPHPYSSTRRSSERRRIQPCRTPIRRRKMGGGGSCDRRVLRGHSKHLHRTPVRRPNRNKNLTSCLLTAQPHPRRERDGPGRPELLWLHLRCEIKKHKTKPKTDAVSRVAVNTSTTSGLYPLVLPEYYPWAYQYDRVSK